MGFKQEARRAIRPCEHVQHNADLRESTRAQNEERNYAVPSMALPDLGRHIERRVTVRYVHIIAGFLQEWTSAGKATYPVPEHGLHDLGRHVEGRAARVRLARHDGVPDAGPRPLRRLRQRPGQPKVRCSSRRKVQNPRDCVRREGRQFLSL